MTGLANRASFNIRLSEEVDHVRRLDQRFAVMCIDLDRFKEVNDLFGHAAGDALLQKVAHAITASVGEIAFAARLGGDEFALIVPDIGYDGDVTGFEALLRWTHPERGPVTPAETPFHGRRAG